MKQPTGVPCTLRKNVARVLVAAAAALARGAAAARPAEDGLTLLQARDGRRFFSAVTDTTPPPTQAEILKFEIAIAAQATPVPGGSTTPDPGHPIVYDAWQNAWEAAGEASESRATVSQARMAIVKNKAQQASTLSSAQSAKNIEISMGAEPEAEKAKKILDDALALEQKTIKLRDTIEKKAYDAAFKAATTRFAKLQAEGKAYFASLLTALKAKIGTKPSNAKLEAAAKAAKPYFEMALRLGEIVFNYNTKAQELVTQAMGMVALAHKNAATANVDQTQGNTVMAQRLMIQAHQLIGGALLKEGQAKRLRKLAESLNMSIPNYQNAASQAAIHVLKTWVGLQISATVKRNPFKAKVEENPAHDALDAITGLHDEACSMGSSLDALMVELGQNLKDAQALLPAKQ